MNSRVRHKSQICFVLVKSDWPVRPEDLRSWYISSSDSLILFENWGVNILVGKTVPIRCKRGTTFWLEKLCQYVVRGTTFWLDKLCQYVVRGTTFWCVFFTSWYSILCRKNPLATYFLLSPPGRYKLCGWIEISGPHTPPLSPEDSLQEGLPWA